MSVKKVILDWMKNNKIMNYIVFSRSINSLISIIIPQVGSVYALKHKSNGLTVKLIFEQHDFILSDFLFETFERRRFNHFNFNIFKSHSFWKNVFFKVQLKVVFRILLQYKYWSNFSVNQFKTVITILICYFVLFVGL